MMTYIKNLILFYLIWPFKVFKHPNYQISYSSFGEDVFMNRILKNPKDGFFIDIGAHHPVYASNTYFFYRKGWHGINIDASENSIKTFNVYRKRDINIFAAISDIQDQKVNYYEFDNSSVNTISDDDAQDFVKKGYKLINRKTISTKTINSILGFYLQEGQKIDILTIDVEGMDDKIIKSFDLNMYQPKLIVFESLNLDRYELVRSETILYLKSFGYELAGLLKYSIVMIKDFDE